MSKSPITQAQIDAFLKTLTTWAKSLPTDQQAILHQLLVRAKSGGDFSLSDEQLSHAVGGLAAILPSLSVSDMGGGGMWAEWSQRKY